MIQLLDKNKDHRITYTEFVRFACLLPETQLANGNVAFCWVDSADFVDGIESRLSMVRSPLSPPCLATTGGSRAPLSAAGPVCADPYCA